MRDLLEPCESESLRWLRDVLKVMTGEEVALWCGCTESSITDWRKGRNAPSPAMRRLIWLLWCMHYGRDRIATLYDCMTWGRFAPSARLETGWHRGKRRGKPPMETHLTRMHRAKREAKEAAQAAQQTTTGSVPSIANDMSGK